jgi:hypothetical protein
MNSQRFAGVMPENKLLKFQLDTQIKTGNLQLQTGKM